MDFEASPVRLPRRNVIQSFQRHFTERAMQLHGKVGRQHAPNGRRSLEASCSFNPRLAQQQSLRAWSQRSLHAQSSPYASRVGSRESSERIQCPDGKSMTAIPFTLARASFRLLASISVVLRQQIVHALQDNWTSLFLRDNLLEQPEVRLTEPTATA
jgi:hypothetical protein